LATLKLQLERFVTFHPHSPLDMQPRLVCCTYQAQKEANANKLLMQQQTSTLQAQLAMAEAHLQAERAKHQADYDAKPASAEIVAEMELLKQQLAKLNEDHNLLQGIYVDLQANAYELEAKNQQNELLIQQLTKERDDYKLKSEQYQARFKSQDDRIHDLEGQLKSLYTAYELLQADHSHELKRFAKHAEHLKASDEELARQMFAEEKVPLHSLSFGWVSSWCAPSWLGIVALFVRARPTHSFIVFPVLTRT